MQTIIKARAKVLLLLTIYLFLYSFLAWWFTHNSANHAGGLRFSMKPVFIFIGYSAGLNLLFFVLLKLMLRFSGTHLSYLASRSLALGMILFIVLDAIFAIPLNEFCLIAIGIGCMTIFVVLWDVARRVDGY